MSVQGLYESHLESKYPQKSVKQRLNILYNSKFFSFASRASFTLFHNSKAKFALSLTLFSTSRISIILACKVCSPRRYILSKGAGIFDKGTHDNARLHDVPDLLIMSNVSLGFSGVYCEEESWSSTDLLRESSIWIEQLVLVWIIHMYFWKQAYLTPDTFVVIITAPPFSSLSSSPPSPSLISFNFILNCE